MQQRVTREAERNQVCFRILAGLAAKFLVVNLEVGPGSARLAFPTVTLQHLFPESFVQLRIEGRGRLERIRFTMLSRSLVTFVYKRRTSQLKCDLLRGDPQESRGSLG
jgi:hypothetical protein